MTTYGNGQVYVEDGAEDETKETMTTQHHTCAHDVTEREVAAVADGLCPLCLKRENAELRAREEQVAVGFARWCDENTNTDTIEACGNWARAFAAFKQSDAGKRSMGE